MTFDQVGEEESIYGLKKIIFNLLYKLEMDVMQFLNHPSDIYIMIKSPTDKKIIQWVMDWSLDNDRDSDNSCVLQNISPKEKLLAVKALNMKKKKCTKYCVHFAKTQGCDWVYLKQMTLDLHFRKEYI